MKDVLLEEYNKYLPRFEKQIIDNLIMEGKTNLGKLTKSRKISFQDLIYTNDYFITNLDLWLLLDKYKIPSIFISSKPLIQTNRMFNELVTYGSSADNFVFILVHSAISETIPEYSIIQSTDDNIFLSTNNLTNENCISNISDAINRKISIENYLQQFTKKNAYKKRTYRKRNG